MKRIVGYGIGIVVCIVMMVVGTFGSFYFMHGKAMENGLKDNDLVYVHKTKDVRQGDVIAFYYNNKILVKRVIAQAGEWVDIDENGAVSVNGRPLDEPYVKEPALGECDIELPYQVPDGRCFVMGDHRSTSVDSRSTAVGCVAQEQVVGKIVFRVWPLSALGAVGR